MPNNNNEFEKILSLMRSDDSVDPPADAVKWVRDLYRTRQAEKPSLLRTIRAILTWDTAAGEPIIGERSASAAKARQMGFTAGEDEIDIAITKTGRHFTLRGQLLSEAFAGAPAVLTIDGTEMETTISDTGEFVFEKVAAGTCDLTISGDGKRIEVKAIELV